MITSCATALQECSQSSQIAQSAVVQCTALAANNANHIAHAIAVFSELGLGVAAAALVDPLKWRERSIQVSTDAVARQDLLSQARMMGGIARRVIGFVTSPKWGWVKFYTLPFVGMFFGFAALLGMSGLICHINERWWLSLGILSFIISLVLPVIMTTAIREQPKVKETLAETLKKDIS